jgi:hypothetical protein
MIVGKAFAGSKALFDECLYFPMACGPAKARPDDLAAEGAAKQAAERLSSRERPKLTEMPRPAAEDPGFRWGDGDQ